MRVIVHGQVQGVAFRHYTHRRAEEVGVSGWVRNRPDGSVEALFEGPEKAVRNMVEWCRSGPPAALVERLEVSQEDYRGEFDSFNITY
jgi:acylphosphatase